MRLLDRNNYYLVRANAFEGNVRFYKVVAGRRIQLAGADIRSPPASGTTSPSIWLPILGLQ